MKRKALLSLTLAGALILTLSVPVLADDLPEQPIPEQWVDPQQWDAPEGWTPEVWDGPIIWTDAPTNPAYPSAEGLPEGEAPVDSLPDGISPTGGLPGGDAAVDALPDGSFPAGAPAPESPAQPAKPWYAEAVEYVTQRNIMTGSGENFDPDGLVTRAMAFQSLWNMEGMPAEKDVAPFSDVPLDCWYQDSASWAQEVGITQGDGLGRYNGQWTISRSELAVAFCRYAQLKGTDVTVANDAVFLNYSDALSVPDYAADAFRWAVDRGVINGKVQDWVMTLDANGSATRSELAAMLMRLSRLLNGEA